MAETAFFPLFHKRRRQSLILNSSFESSVSYWMLPDGWMASTICDYPFLSEKPKLSNDGLAGSELPDSQSARVPEEKWEGQKPLRTIRICDSISKESHREEFM